MYGVIQQSSFILLHVAFQFSQHHLLKRLPFFCCVFVCFWLLCRKFVWVYFENLSLSSTGLCVLFFCQYRIVLIIVVWSQGMWYLWLLFLSSGLLWLFGVFCGLTHIWGFSLVPSLWTCHWDYDRDCIKSIHCVR